jgi:hypothetical protein
MSKFATGKHAIAISDRSGAQFPYREMVKEWNGSLVHYTEYDPKQPQLEPKPVSADGVALLNVRPARTEPATTVSIPNNGFETYQAGSGIINVYSPGHGLTDSTIYVFRGAPTVGGNYANPSDFDGITGANIAYPSGYTIRTGQFISGVRDASTDYLATNFFYFTVNTDTATIGNIKGGGYGCSVGPVTISP